MTESRPVLHSRGRRPGPAIRPFQLGYLIKDFFANYLLFVPAMIIWGLVVWLFPEHESDWLFFVIFSFLILQPASAMLSGNRDRMKLGLGKIFDQFATSGLIVVILVLTLFFGYLIGIPVSDLVRFFVDDEDIEKNTRLTVATLFCILVLARMWPMLVMQYLFADVADGDLEESIVRGITTGAEGDSYPGQTSTFAISWRLTGISGAFLSATLPALVFAAVTLIGAFGIRDMLPEMLDPWWLVAMVTLIVPLIYLVTMDRAMALREAITPRAPDVGVVHGLGRPCDV